MGLGDTAGNGSGTVGARASRTLGANTQADDAHSGFHSQVARGLMAALRQSAAEGEGTATLRLQPQALGRLKVEVVFREGAISARFEVSTPEARQLLDRSLADLRSTLGDKGLSIDKLDIQLAPPEQQRAHAASETPASHWPQPETGADGRGSHPGPAPEGEGGHRGAADHHRAEDPQEAVPEPMAVNSPPSLTLQLVDTLA